MPTISRFYGIMILIYFKDKEHEPPHFHAVYGDEEEAILIETGKVMQGKLPLRAHRLVIEWWDEHRAELLDIWESQVFRKIPPLT